jgi:DNA end-binding protein Ku
MRGADSLFTVGTMLALCPAAKASLPMKRSSWRGYLRLSLVSVPVRAFNAAGESEGVRLNQLHQKCMSRIKYQKTCPIHGEVTNDEIVSGYEYEKGQYVVIDKEEIAALKGERERSITIDAMVPPGTINPLYFTDKSYYLGPDGKIADKPYALLMQAMADEGLEAVGHGVLFGREEMMLIHPRDGFLAVTALKYHAEVSDTSELERVSTEGTKREELTLTKTLLRSFTDKNFDLSAFTDHYARDFAELVTAKVEGREIVAPKERELEPTINMMDALKRSLAKDVLRNSLSRKTTRARKPAEPRRRKTG